VFTRFQNCTPTGATEDQTFGFGKAWSALVTQYCRLGITNKTDLLPALSGLAQHVEYLNPGQYIAGLWERDISFLLGWKVRQYAFKRQFADLNYPTFSWISAPAGIYWPYNEPVIPKCVLVSATCHAATENPYGHIIDCSIRIQGHLLPGSRFFALSLSPRHESHFEWYRYRLIFTLDNKPIPEQRSYPLLHSDWDFLAVLGLFHTKQEPPQKMKEEAIYRVVGLMLRRNQKDGTYSRLGIVEGIPMSWFEEFATKEVVTLV